MDLGLVGSMRLQSRTSNTVRESAVLAYASFAKPSLPSSSAVPLIPAPLNPMEDYNEETNDKAWGKNWGKDCLFCFSPEPFSIYMLGVHISSVTCCHTRNKTV